MFVFFPKLRKVIFIFLFGLFLKLRKSTFQEKKRDLWCVDETFRIFLLQRHNRGVHAHSCIMCNQGKMERGNSKICIGIQSQLILPEFIYLMLSL